MLGDQDTEQAKLLEGIEEEEEELGRTTNTVKASILKRAPILDENQRELSHKEKLDILKERANRFTDDLNFWPIFDTSVLSRYSFVFFYYYELYFFLFKLLLLMTVLAFGYYIISSVFNAEGRKLVGMWVFFGYSVVTTIIVRLCTMSEEKRVMEERSHQGEDWTENKFSLLVENLPIAATKEEIKEFFESKIRQKGCEDKIREVMFIQDSSVYVKLEKKLRKLTYESKKNFIQSSELMSEISEIQAQMDAMLRSVQDFQQYRGTAIVIFETLRGKILIEDFFKMGKYQRLMYSSIPKSFGKEYKLEDHVLRVKEAPEPTDIIFEKIYVKKSQIYLRRILAYALASIAVLLGIYTIIIVKVDQNEQESGKRSLIIYSGIIIIMTLLIYATTDFILERIMLHRTKFARELEKIKIRLVITYFSINVYLVVLMYKVKNFTIYNWQVLLTSIILVLLVPLRKVFAALGLQKLWQRRSLYRDENCFHKYTEREIVEIFSKPEYDFANNLEDIMCFMFFCLGFYFIGQIFIVAIILVGLMICVCVDKWVMIKMTSPTRIKGSEMGLEFFRVLRWDVRLQLLTIAFVPSHAFLPEKIPGELSAILIVIFVVFLFWGFRESLRKTWKKQWCKEREETKYSDVQQFFHHRYRDEYPYSIY